MFMSAMLGCSTITAALSTRPVDGLPQVLPPSLDHETQKESFEYGTTSVHEPGGTIDANRLPDQNHQSRLEQLAAHRRENHSASWLWLYIPGLVTGLAGLFSLVKQNWHIRAVQLITYIIWGIPGGFAILGVIITAIVEEKDKTKKVVTAFGGAIGLAVMALAVFGALYSDWILGAIAGNFGGVPSGDNLWLYWGYFFAKKLPLGSM